MGFWLGFAFGFASAIAFVYLAAFALVAFSERQEDKLDRAELPDRERTGIK